MSQLLSTNAIRAVFDPEQSDDSGSWELCFDEAHPENVTLVVHTAGETPKRLISQLDADAVEHMIKWLDAARSHMGDREAEPEPRPASKLGLVPRLTLSGLLSTSQLERAVAYNSARPYAPDLWRAIQRHVGADADGIPGPETARASAAYQHRARLRVDGKIGPGTLGRMNIGPIRALDDHAFFFMGHMAVDADGAPNAYNRSDSGIDFLANAGRPGRWWGVATNGRGIPYVQDQDDPFPGYYISTTALIDSTHPPRDPRRYVDANTVPYIVMPRNIHDLVAAPTVHKGDLAVVVRRAQPDRVVYAIYADVGPEKTLDPARPFGEGSIALAQALDHDPFVVRRGIRRAAVGLSDDIFYVVFPGTGIGRSLPPAVLNERANAAFQAWGGMAKLQRALTIYDAPQRISPHD